MTAWCHPALSPVSELWLYLSHFSLLDGFKILKRQHLAQGQVYTWNHTFKKREEGSISFSFETYTFLWLWKKCLMGNPPEGGRSKSTFCSISLLWQGISGCMCHRMHQKNLPCDSVCTRHKHVQSRVWADAEGSSILGRCFTDHPVKHCAVLMKMVIIIKNVFGRYKRERLACQGLKWLFKSSLMHRVVFTCNNTKKLHTRAIWSETVSYILDQSQLKITWLSGNGNHICNLV